MRPVEAVQNKKLAYLPGAKKQRAPLKRRVAFFLVTLAVGYFGFLFATQYWRLVQLRSTLENIERDIKIVREQNSELFREIERMNSPAYLEEMARQELGMVRSGELLFFLQDGSDPTVDNH